MKQMIQNIVIRVQQERTNCHDAHTHNSYLNLLPKQAKSEAILSTELVQLKDMLCKLVRNIYFFKSGKIKCLAKYETHIICMQKIPHMMIHNINLHCNYIWINMTFSKIKPWPSFIHTTIMFLRVNATLSFF